MNKYRLYTGDIGFSSWSFRGLMILERAQVTFERVQVQLDWPFKLVLNGVEDIDEQDLEIEPACSCGCEVSQLTHFLDKDVENIELIRLLPRVPILEDTINCSYVFDVLAIADYLEKNESIGDCRLWPCKISDYGQAKSLAHHISSDYFALLHEMSFSQSFRNKELVMSDAIFNEAERLLKVLSYFLSKNRSFLFDDYSVCDILTTTFAQSFLGWNYPLDKYPSVQNYFLKIIEYPIAQKYFTEALSFYNGINEFQIDSPVWIARHYRFSELFSAIHNCRTNVVHKLDNESAKKMFELAYKECLGIEQIALYFSQTYNISLFEAIQDVTDFFETIHPKNDSKYQTTIFKFNSTL